MARKAIARGAVIARPIGFGLGRELHCSGVLQPGRRPGQVPKRSERGLPRSARPPIPRTLPAAEVLLKEFSAHLQ